MSHDESNPDDIREQAEKLAEISYLSQQQAYIIRLIQHGYTQTEIRDIVGHTSVDSVSTQVSRVRKKRRRARNTLRILSGDLLDLEEDV